MVVAVNALEFTITGEDSWVLAHICLIMRQLLAEDNKRAVNGRVYSNEVCDMINNFTGKILLGRIIPKSEDTIQ